MNLEHVLNRLRQSKAKPEACLSEKMTIIDPLRNPLCFSAPIAKHEENSACTFCHFFFFFFSNTTTWTSAASQARRSAFDCVSFAVTLECFFPPSSVSPASKLPSGFAVTLGSFVGWSIVIMRALHRSGSAPALCLLAV